MRNSRRYVYNPAVEANVLLARDREEGKLPRPKVEVSEWEVGSLPPEVTSTGVFDRCVKILLSLVRRA